MQRWQMLKASFSRTLFSFSFLRSASVTLRMIGFKGWVTCLSSTSFGPTATVPNSMPHVVSTMTSSPLTTPVSAGSK